MERKLTGIDRERWEEDICSICFKSTGDVGRLKDKGSYDKCMVCGTRFHMDSGMLYADEPDPCEGCTRRKQFCGKGPMCMRKLIYEAGKLEDKDEEP